MLNLSTHKMHQKMKSCETNRKLILCPCSCCFCFPSATPGPTCHNRPQVWQITICLVIEDWSRSSMPCKTSSTPRDPDSQEPEQNTFNYSQTPSTSWIVQNKKRISPMMRRVIMSKVITTSVDTWSRLSVCCYCTHSNPTPTGPCLQDVSPCSLLHPTQQHLPHSHTQELIKTHK